MALKEDQWYQLPSGQWCKAVFVDDPRGPTLMGYGLDLAGSDGYKVIIVLGVYPDDTLSGVTGNITWDTWTLADLREATPDEAERQTHRAAGLPMEGL